MGERFMFHFEPQQGWMNDPNGLIFFQGRYHAFFQHYPYEPYWGQMHWGHAVSDDLLHWEELPVALFPDQEYENDGGCFSGSAVKKDGRLHLMYTSVSHEMGQTQSLAYSDDGVHFTKHPCNPLIRENPVDSRDFRDPKITFLNGRYYMVVGSGDENSGKVLLYSGTDLVHWDYNGILFQGEEYAPCIECPDFFPFGERYVLMFSKMNEKERSTVFVVGDFVDGKLVNYTIDRPEWGIDFYAPQTFSDGQRRIMIGWMYHWGKDAPAGCSFAGALSIPRELKLAGDQIRIFPVEEAQHLLRRESPYVRWEGEYLTLLDRAGNSVVYHIPGLRRVDILEDTKSVEVFVNRGESSYTRWLE